MIIENTFHHGEHGGHGEKLFDRVLPFSVVSVVSVVVIFGLAFPCMDCDDD
jgi:hypothetical protein